MINLFINPFECQDKIRDEEYKECLQRNVENPLIDRIIFVRENSQATYSDFFLATKKYPEGINIISNLDIYFDQSLSRLLPHTFQGKEYKGIQSNECYALTRWNIKKGNAELFVEHGQWSQDVWIFKGAVDDRVKAPFGLGLWGCDNHVAYLIGQRYRITNPSHSIRAFHLHNSDLRPDNKGRVGTRSSYKMVHPVAL